VTWYEESFGEDYLTLYPHRDLAEARSDIAAIVGLIEPPTAEPLLDLCCGAGRHLQALHDAGFTDLTGVDLSQHLLDVARQHLDAIGGSEVRLARADMRELPFRDRFQTVLSLFTSFGYFRESTEDEAALRAARATLRPGGTFLLDTLSRSWTIDHLEPHAERTIDGRRLDIRRTISADGLRVEKTTRVTSDDTPPKLYRESVRMYTVDELAALLERAGFADVRFHGALDGRPHDTTSPRMIAVARRPKEVPA
jgi:SAM-dependent methyltransferase